MSITMTGVVRNGVVVPSGLLPEGKQVEIHFDDASPEVPPELQEELAAWQCALPMHSIWSINWPKRIKPMKRGEVCVPSGYLSAPDIRKPENDRPSSFRTVNSMQRCQQFWSSHSRARKSPHDLQVHLSSNRTVKMD